MADDRRLKEIEKRLTLVEQAIWWLQPRGAFKVHWPPEPKPASDPFQYCPEYIHYDSYHTTASHHT